MSAKTIDTRSFCSNCPGDIEEFFRKNPHRRYVMWPLTPNLRYLYPNLSKLPPGVSFVIPVRWDPTTKVYGPPIGWAACFDPREIPEYLLEELFKLTNLQALAEQQSDHDAVARAKARTRDILFEACARVAGFEDPMPPGTFEAYMDFVAGRKAS